MKVEDFSGWLSAIAGLSVAQRGAALRGAQASAGDEDQDIVLIKASSMSGRSAPLAKPFSAGRTNGLERRKDEGLVRFDDPLGGWGMSLAGPRRNRWR